MKKISILLSLLFFSGLAYSQCTWQNPFPTGNKLQSVCFTDINTGYSAGQNGTILKTTDGGASWTSLSSGTGCDLTSIVFPDASTGYAAGGNLYPYPIGTILKTTDAGLN